VKPFLEVVRSQDSVLKRLIGQKKGVFKKKVKGECNLASISWKVCLEKRASGCRIEM
jgi:hypothetical protein